MRHRGLNKMGDIFKRFSIAFSQKKIFGILIETPLKFVCKGPIDLVGSGNGLVPYRQQAIAWTNDDQVHKHMYVWYHVATSPQCVTSGIKTGSGDVCCHSARGHVRTGRLNPEAVRSRDWTYCSHKPECIVTTNLARPVLVTIIRWLFNFKPWMYSAL